MNLISDLQRCLKSIEYARAENASRLPQEAARELALLEMHLQRILARVEDIDKKFLRLSAIEDVKEIFAKARQQHALLPDGRLGENDIQPLVSQSRLLSELRRGNVDVVEMYKFSQSEMDLAKELGPNFAALDKIWSHWRYSATKGGPHHIWMPSRGKMDGEEFKPNIWFKRFHDLIRPVYADDRDFPVLIARKRGIEFSADSQEWAALKDGWKNFQSKFYKSDASVAVQLGQPVHRKLFEFMMGKWFEAYVAHQFDDQLARVGVPNETFTGVKYKARLHSDVYGVDTRTLGGHFSGELDVVIATEKKIACIECKSGRLRPEDVKTALLRKDVIQGVLKEVGLNPEMTEFALVHARKSGEEELIDQLQQQGMPVLSPAEVSQYARKFATS